MTASSYAGAPVGICLHAYGPEAPPEKIDCFEFEKLEKTPNETRFFLPNGKSAVVTNYRNRGVILYPNSKTFGPALAEMLKTYEAHTQRSPTTRQFLNPWILKLRNGQAAVAQQAEKVAELPTVTLADGTVLKGCKAVKKDATTISLMHADGIKKVSIAELNEATKKALDLDALPLTTAPTPKGIAKSDSPDPVTEGGSSSNNSGQAATEESFEPAPPKPLPADAPKKVKDFRAAADQGDAKAQVALANCYNNGTGIPKDTSEAVKWFKKAAEQGNTSAQSNLGILYVDRSDMLAYMWLEIASELGGDAIKRARDGMNGFMKPAEIERAQRMARGWKADFSNNDGGVFGPDALLPGEVSGKQDKLDAEASVRYKDAADQGNALAQLRLGECFDYGKGVTQDQAAAVTWYRKAADQGLAPAQFILGMRYADEKGPLKDQVEAFKWYRKAATAGMADAQLFLGSCYELGEGTSENLEEAFKWYRKAAEQGLPSAQFNLARGYQTGRGTPEDLGEAVKWYQAAANQCYPDAQMNLGGLSPPTPATRSRSTASSATSSAPASSS